jgi:hypothetical protein
MSLWIWAFEGPVVHCQGDTRVNTEQRWNDTDRRKPKDSVKEPVAVPLCSSQISDSLIYQADADDMSEGS